MKLCLPIMDIKFIKAYHAHSFLVPEGCISSTYAHVAKLPKTLLESGMTSATQDEKYFVFVMFVKWRVQKEQLAFGFSSKLRLSEAQIPTLDTRPWSTDGYMAK